MLDAHTYYLFLVTAVVLVLSPNLQSVEVEASSLRWRWPFLSWSRARHSRVRRLAFFSLCAHLSLSLYHYILPTHW